MAIRINSVLFYQLCSKDRERACSLNWKDIKPELQDDVYEVKETDGTFNYAFVSHADDGFVNVSWMEEREYELHLYDLAMEDQLGFDMIVDPVDDDTDDDTDQ